jgi:DNA repair exonuclease SbcCD ATPase subunit
MAKRKTPSKKSPGRKPADSSALVEQLLEQRQQDAAAIAALQERGAEQAQLVSRLERQIEDSNKQRVEWEQARRSELEALAKQLRESLRSGGQLGTPSVGVKLLEETVERLTREVADLKRGMGAEGALSTSGERADSPTAHRMGELDQATRQLRREFEARQDRISLLEEGLKRQLSEASRRVDEVRHSVDEARTAEAQHQKQLSDFHQRLKEVDQLVEDWRAQKQLFDQQYQRGRQVVDKLEALQTQLTNRQNEVAEMQRLAEDRVKRQWEEWKLSTQELLRSHEASVEEQYRIHDRRNQEVKDELARLVETVEAHNELMSLLIERQRAQIEHASETADLLSRADRLLASSRTTSPKKAQ